MVNSLEKGFPFDSDDDQRDPALKKLVTETVRLRKEFVEAEKELSYKKARMFARAECMTEFELQQLQLFQKNKSKMAAEEIDKFVRKFKDLWHSGLDAHSDIDAHAGEAWVGLCVRVGGSPNTFCPKSEKSRDSPSRERRRVRRAAMTEKNSPVNMV